MKQTEQASENHRNARENTGLTQRATAQGNIVKENSASLRRLWEELHPGPPPPIAHPIPRLTPRPIPLIASRPVATPAQIKSRRWKLRPRGLGIPRAILHPSAALLVAISLLATVALLTTGCQVLTYAGPNGERFSRSAFGASVSISELAVEKDTNGLRRVQMQGYQNNSSQILGAVTEAAIRAALQAPK
jgi:hypothetical protein